MSAGPEAVSSQATRLGRLLPLLFPLLLFLALPAMGGGFYLDSEGHLRSIPYLGQTTRHVEEVVSFLVRNPVPAARRPLPLAMLYLEDALVGVTPASSRIVNIAIHCLVVLALFRLLVRTLPPTRMRPAVALYSSLLFALNPFFADVVLYSVQRATLLATLFYILSLLGYIEARRGRRIAWVPFATFAILALLAKENALLLPLGIGCLEWVAPLPRLVHRRRALLGTLCLLFALGLLPLALGYRPLAIFRLLLHPTGEGPWPRLLTEGRILVHYLTLLLLPLPSRLSLVMKYRLSHSLHIPITTAISWGVVLLLIVAAIRLRRRRPLLSLACLWYFTHHLLESTILPLELAFPHRCYLPAIFLFSPVAAALSEKRRRPLLAAILILFAAGWHLRARTYRDPEIFWRDALKKAPGSLRPALNLGAILDNRGRIGEALDVYREAEERSYGESRGAVAALRCCEGIALARSGRQAEGEAKMEEALSSVALPDCLVNYAGLELAMGNVQKAAKAIEKLQRIDPTHRKLHLLLAKLRLHLGDIDGASAALKIELQLHPNEAEAQTLLSALVQGK